MRYIIDLIEAPQVHRSTSPYSFLCELEQLQEISGWRKGLAAGALALGALTATPAHAQNDAMRYYQQLVTQMTEINQAADSEQGVQDQSNDEIRAAALKATQRKFGIASNPNPDVNQSLANPASDDWGNPTQTVNGPTNW